MLRIFCKTIVPVTVAKDLGIYIDQSLTYNDDITKTVFTCPLKVIRSINLGVDSVGR